MHLNKELFVLFVLILLVGIIAGYAVNQLQDPKSKVSNLDWKEPSALDKDVKNSQDILDDLESLGCVLIDDVHEFGHYGNIIRIDNYVEFRRIAYNTKIVFYGYDYEGAVLCCYTILEGAFVSYSYY